MSEEKEPSSQEGERHRRSSGQQRRRQRSVFQYIAILFAAAFVLLLFTYVMDRRQNALLQQQNQEQIDNLQQSVSAVQSLQNLYDENAALKDKVDELEGQLEEAQTSIDSMTDTLASREQELEQTKVAMDYFWQIDEAYVRGRYALCRSLITVLEDNADGKTPLKDFLPSESYTDNDRFSPADRYQEIYNKLY